jgi:hypothetical protein
MSVLCICSEYKLKETVMIFPENDIQAWKNDLKDYDTRRKNF